MTRCAVAFGFAPVSDIGATPPPPAPPSSTPLSLPSQRANKGWLFDKINYHGLFTLSTVHPREGRAVHPPSRQPDKGERGESGEEGVVMGILGFPSRKFAVILRC